jgi:hypothetical protein
MRATYPSLIDLTAEEFAFLVERTPAHPTLVARLEALEHLRAAGIPVPPRTLTQEVRDAFAQLEAQSIQTRTLH